MLYSQVESSSKILKHHGTLSLEMWIPVPAFVMQHFKSFIYFSFFTFDVHHSLCSATLTILSAGGGGLCVFPNTHSQR